MRSGTHQLLEILAGTHKVVILQKLVCAGTQELVRSACSKKKLVRSWEYSKEIDYVNSSYCGVGVFGNAQTPKLVRPKRTSWCVPQCASCSKKTGNASVGAFRNAGARVFPNAPTVLGEPCSPRSYRSGDCFSVSCCYLSMLLAWATWKVLLKVLNIAVVQLYLKVPQRWSIVAWCWNPVYHLCGTLVQGGQ